MGLRFNLQQCLVALFCRKWVREIFAHRRLGAQTLLDPHLRQDDEYFFKYYRMNVEDFDYLLVQVRPLIAQTLLDPHLRQDDEYFFKYYRMNVEDFDYLLVQVRPLIEKKFTHWREPISPETRLAISLR